MTEIVGGSMCFSKGASCENWPGLACLCSKCGKRRLDLWRLIGVQTVRYPRVTRRLGTDSLACVEGHEDE